MAFYGLTTYDRCIKLLEIFKKNNINEITEEELAKYIAKYIGSSLFYKTVKNYIGFMVGFGMIINTSNNKYKINYECLNDK